MSPQHSALTEPSLHEPTRGARIMFRMWMTTVIGGFAVMAAVVGSGH